MNKIQKLSRAVLLVLILSSAISCAFKKDDETPTAGSVNKEVVHTSSIEVTPLTDSDGDFIADSIELSVGTDPKLADIPELNVNLDKNMYLSYTIGVGDTFSQRSEITHNISKDRMGKDIITYASDIPAIVRPIESYTSAILFDLFDEVMGNKLRGGNISIISGSGKLQLNLIVGLKDNPYYFQIIDPRFTLYDFNEKRIGASSSTLFTIDNGIKEIDLPLSITSISSSQVNEIINLKTTLGLLKVEDFKINYHDGYSGVKTYQELIKSIQKKCIHLIVHSGVAQQSFFVAESAGADVASILKYLYKDDFIVTDGTFTLKGFPNFQKWDIETNKLSRDLYTKVGGGDRIIIRPSIQEVDSEYKKIDESLSSYRGPETTNGHLSQACGS